VNLLVLTQYFWPENFRINDLVLSLKGSGVDVSVLTGKPNYPEGIIYPGYRTLGTMLDYLDGVQVWRVPVIPRGGGGGLRLMANYISFVLSAGLLAPFLLFRKRIDVIFIYAPSPLLQAMAALPLKWIKGAPMVIWVQDLWPESLAATGHIRNRLALRIVEFFVRTIYSRSDLILIQSEGFRKPISRFADSKKIHYFPNPADEPGEAKNKYTGVGAEESIQAGKFSVVFAGNLGFAQSLETIVEAALILKTRRDICFYLIGDGSRASWMDEQIAIHKLDNVVMLGRYPADVMPDFFAKASALLVTLKDEFIFSLTVPSKVQTYLAAGRPIIAALNGEGRRIVLESKAGIACPASDGPALAEAVARLADLPEDLRQEMGVSGQRYCKTHYNLLRLTDELILHLKKMVRD